MRNVEEFQVGGTTYYVDLDHVVYIERMSEPDKLWLRLTNTNRIVAIPVQKDGETELEAVERVIDHWTCNRGRPEFIEGWFDTEGPVTGWGGKFLIDLSAVVVFNFSGGALGRSITVLFDSSEGRGHKHTFWLKPDPDKTADGQGAEIEARWRRARGERV